MRKYAVMLLVVLAVSMMATVASAGVHSDGGILEPMGTAHGWYKTK